VAQPVRSTAPSSTGSSLARERDACGVGFVAQAGGVASHEVLSLALEALRRVRHRGAVAADGVSSDGAGLLLPIPRALIGASVPPGAVDPADAGLLQLLVRDDPGRIRSLVERAGAEEGVAVAAWRDVPVDPSVLGHHARETMPHVMQAVLAPPPRRARRERAAFRTRRRIESAVRSGEAGCYVVSCSYSTVTYKALVGADLLGAFYPDLTDPLSAAAFAIFHQRFSTNTTPSWERAQPFRSLCHNGEINTIAGNVAHLRAREGGLGVGALDEDLLRPVVDERGSDSAMLDETVDLLMREGQVAGGGRDARHAVAMLLPAAWEGGHVDDPELVAFYRYHAALIEPWDGPAALVFTDGVGVGAAMDRNGLRPLRYASCGDGLVVCASEAGVVDTAGRGVVRRGAVGPGGMLWVDPREGGLQTDPLHRVARRRPYARWVAAARPLGPILERAVEPIDGDELRRRQVVLGYTREELSVIVRAAASSGAEPTFSMGDDTPIAVLSARDRPLHHYLRQRFAQVTNPAIDHVRERSVTSLRTVLGPRDPLLWERPRAASLLELDSCIALAAPRGAPLDATWPTAEGSPGLTRALDGLERAACDAVRDGAAILVVADGASDRVRVPVPSLLAVGVVHRALIASGLRSRASIVAVADDVREAHHVACLIGIGAELVVPRLAAATVHHLALEGRLADDPPGAAVLRFRTALEEGVLKAMARLGISTVDAYHAATAFDAIGLAGEVAERCFGVVSPEGGIGLDEIAASALARHARAWTGDGEPELDNPGFIRFRRGGEVHATEPDLVRALHLVVDPGLERLRSTVAGVTPTAIETDASETAAAHALRGAVRDRGRTDLYDRFSKFVRARPPTEPRDLLAFVTTTRDVGLEEVESVDAICARFSGAAISHGSISAEAHETLAAGLRLVGAAANSGEGGEDPARFGRATNCDIKQVASARFGVTPEYLAHARELQIKIAQGSKPGEGGQLPAIKVTAEIARLRHTQPGIALISPAPHHDIYSIEDLAQLIFDLRQANAEATISVKLVAERGVGTVAAGVVKALADVVHISGADGGTGASPLGSIKHAGLPWELGLAEVRGTLQAEGLRDRVTVRVDGGLKTGRDVMIAALLGADAFAFGTAALIAEGCLMVRSCHLDTCPVGIATQRPELRAAFTGTPEMVATYLRHVAAETRSLLASLGLRSIDDAVGRTDLLRPTTSSGFDVATLLGGSARAPWATDPSAGRTAPPVARSGLGDRVMLDAWPAVRDGSIVDLAYTIGNHDRTVGARLGGSIARRYGRRHPPGFARAAFTGTAGQSFGAFLTDGVEFRLVGEANDYVGKGMGGGRIVIVAPADDAGTPVLAGNAVLYGATGGDVCIAGSAMNRFAVRNAGATATIEGARDHACEYMTGGAVVILGPVGMNVGAGMTGGEAFLLDDGEVRRRVNLDTVGVTRPDGAAIGRLRSMLDRHLALTGSTVARTVLAGDLRRSFLHVRPRAAVVTAADDDDTAVGSGVG
jgi:glutamate synthase domain-containing protein 2/glutamate synthase domain-containing protein 1/glutamate synthase domain-containing protein 3